jgi:gluconokinase
VGHLLADRLGWPFYDGDDFHSPANVEKMRHGTPLTDEDRGPWLATLHQLLAETEQRGDSAILACSALKIAYRRVLSEGLQTLRIVYLQGDPTTLQARLDRRVGHYMPRTMLPSQMAALEEPAGAIVVNAALPAHVIVQQIVDALKA